MKEEGVFGKYIFKKADGSPIAKNADYFVLRLGKDKHARKAILAYADSIKNINPLIAKELREKAEKHA